MNIIIALYGIDGSGKTTLATKLALLLRKEGRKVKVLKLRSHHTLMYFVLAFVLKLYGFSLSELYIKPVLLNFIVRKLFRRSLRLLFILETISAILWIIIHIHLLSLFKRGIVFVADRFLPDFVVIAKFLVGLNTRSMIKLLYFLDRLVIFDTIYLHIYIDPCIAVKRKYNEELSVRFLKMLLSDYIMVTKCLNARTIDTSYKSIKVSLRSILDIIKNRINLVSDNI